MRGETACAATLSGRFHALLRISVLLLTLFAIPTFAQGASASISGRVLDQNHAAISEAHVVLQNVRSSYALSTTTDGAGAFSFQNLARGEYVLLASNTGFADARREVRLSSGESGRVEIVLQAGPVAEQIVVSASRIAGTPEVVERIPGAVEVLDQKLLETARVHTSSEALRKTSGVNVRDEEGFGLRPNIGIRGLNPTRSTKVLLLEDGIPLTYAPYGDNSSYYHPPIDRFETVEVMKGSGQILFGPSTVGGIINYVTRNPPAKPSGSLKLIGGNRDYLNGHFTYGGTWGGTGLLFDLTRKQGEGARENTRFGLTDFNAKAVTAVGSKQALTFKFNYLDEDSNITYSGLTEAEYRQNPRQNPFRNDFFYAERFGASLSHALVFSSDVTLTTNFYGSYFRRHWWRQSSNSGERPNRLATVSGGDPDCLSMADLYATCGNQGRLRKYHFLGVEPRLHVTHRLFGIRNESDFGFRAHYETQQRRQENGDAPNSRRGLVVENNERRNQAYSGFAENRFFVGDWIFTPGVRVEHVEYQRTNRLADGGRGVTGKTSLTQVVPGFGAAYNPSERLTLFAGLHRGFAPPRTEDVINNSTGGVVELDPELSWNYEVGVRTTPADGVRLEATFFRMDYENQIVPASLAGGVGSTLTNGGETLHEGIEFTGRIDTGALRKSAHNFYIRTAYTFLPVSKFIGVRTSSVGGFANVSVSGNRLPYSPEHLLNANIGYAHPSGFDGLLEAVYVGRQFSDDLNTVNPTANGQRGLIPSYTVWNATANYTVERVRTTFFVTVKNLFDRTYIVDRTRGLLPSSPRLLQGGMKFRF